MSKELIRQIQKLQDEGYIKFNNSQSEVIDFIENDMNYIVFDGNISKYTSCRLACGKTWNQVKNLKHKESPSDLDKAYFIENHLRQSWFNFTCWKQLGIVFLSQADYKVIKFHEEKNDK